MNAGHGHQAQVVLAAQRELQDMQVQLDKKGADLKAAHSSYADVAKLLRAVILAAGGELRLSQEQLEDAGSGAISATFERSVSQKTAELVLRARVGR